MYRADAQDEMAALGLTTPIPMALVDAPNATIEAPELPF